MWGSIVLDTSKDAGPDPGSVKNSNFLRLIEHDYEVIVTYEMTKPNGEKGRNTEILRIGRQQDYQCRGLFRLGPCA